MASWPPTHDTHLVGISRRLVVVWEGNDGRTDAWGDRGELGCECNQPTSYFGQYIGPRGGIEGFLMSWVQGDAKGPKLDQAAILITCS